MTVTAYIGVGANLGFARDAVLNGLADLGRLTGSSFVAASGLYRSAPVDGEGPDYINAVAEIETELDAFALLGALQSIELRHGRVRTTRNAPRTLDLDLLLYGDSQINAPDLIVPHPRMATRAFALLPLAELSPGLTVPGIGALSHLLDRLAPQDITRLDE